ncbi:sugar-binding protein [Planctomicrobium piriforme]|uniref:Ribose transport system substrate-binding protein n=1 Tax=Planctomicrobium piriforme TaxID=1576369 RepID=A0A1I3NFA6_9PLAN|nr:sugar-binding protein [Planctomicrobium piriforme]SFJ07817.1 ribose transport system substrate-binding protein [Planctomicrobium piriforme]
MKCPARTRALIAVSCLFTLLAVGCPGETPKPGPAGSGPAPTGTKRIVILTNGDDPFWDACEAGAMKAEEELGLTGQGYAVTFDRADFTDKGQVDKIKQYALQKDLVAFGISVFNPDSPAVAKELKALQDRGIKVVTIDGDMNREKYRDTRFAYLGTDNIVGGRELGRAGKALTPDGSKFAFFVGNTGAANAIARMEGFVEGAGEKFTEVERLEDRGDRPTARKNVQDALDRHPDTNMLVGIWAYNTPQAVAVVKDRKIRDKEKVLCFDSAEASISAMKDGNVDVMVVQNPYQMGFIGVKLLKALVEDDKAIVNEMYPTYSHEGTNDLFQTELRVVVPNAESPIKADLFEKDTVFMTLEEFEKWLKERGLTSS